jgi:UDP-3-O-[3-hydroxymyristoyl] glucosamine N-acyltransferase
MEFKYNVNKLSSSYNFDITGVSYVGNPLNNTVMYVTKKVETLVKNIGVNSNCLIFVEDGTYIPEELKKNNLFVSTKNPQKDYAEFVMQMDKIIIENNKSRKYKLTEGGYYIGENVQIGENTKIEPLAFIDHDVVIGKDSYIKAGATIRNCIAGDGLVACERCTIGTYGFTMMVDDNGDRQRIPTLGKVIIENNVEVGALTNISCGSAGNTILKSNSKIDSLVHIGHDVCIDESVEIAAGAIIGGFAVIKKNTFVGINSAIRNRKEVGINSYIGMSSAVVNDVADNNVVIGVPAKFLRENK